jgi:hypothetical protein
MLDWFDFLEESKPMKNIWFDFYNIFLMKIKQPIDRILVII